MIGDVPKGAPLRCRLRMHTGQRDGGLLVFTCPRCGGSYWQTRTKYRTAMEQVRAAEARGDFDSAHRIYKSTMGLTEATYTGYARPASFTSAQIDAMSDGTEQQP